MIALDLLVKTPRSALYPRFAWQREVGRDLVAAYDSTHQRRVPLSRSVRFSHVAVEIADGRELLGEAGPPNHHDDKVDSDQ